MKRMQRSRAKGWRMPDGAVYVGRPTKWGNPHRVGDALSREQAVSLYRSELLGGGIPTSRQRGDTTTCITPEMVRRELRDRDLVCWCRLDQPCHADVLIEVANT